MTNVMSCKSMKLAVLGAAGVGKSAMVVRFITGRFLHHYDPTLEDEYNVETEVEGQLCNITILDTAGENAGNTNYLSMVDAVLVVFSLGDQASLDTAKQLLQTIRISNQNSPKPLPVVLVGTKCDLRSHQRVLSYDSALVMARDYECTYMETSSAVNINVLEAFQTAISMVIMQHSCVEISKVVKKTPHSAKRKVRSIWSRINRFRKDKKLLDSLAVSPTDVEVDIRNLLAR